MEKYSEYLQFSTAVPFGYLIFYTLCLVAWFWGVKNIISSIRRRNFSSVGFLGGNLAAGFVSMLFFADLIFSTGLELNPSFGHSEVVGSWADGNSHIQFRPDGTAHFALEKIYADRLGVISEEGTWKKWQDFTIRIADNNSARPLPLLRVIKKYDEYRIIVEDFDDFDMWDHHLGFKKSSE